MLIRYNKNWRIQVFVNQTKLKKDICMFAFLNAFKGGKELFLKRDGTNLHVPRILVAYKLFQIKCGPLLTMLLLRIRKCYKK